MAIRVLVARGVPEERILFLNLIATPRAIQNMVAKFPKVKVVTAFIDQVCFQVLILHSVAGKTKTC